MKGKHTNLTLNLVTNIMVAILGDFYGSRHQSYNTDGLGILPALILHTRSMVTQQHQV